MADIQDIQVSRTNNGNGEYSFTFENTGEGNVSFYHFVEKKENGEWKGVTETSVISLNENGDTFNVTRDVDVSDGTELRSSLFSVSDFGNRVVDTWVVGGNGDTGDGGDGDTGDGGGDGDTGGGGNGDTGGGGNGDTGGGNGICQIVKPSDGEDARQFVFGDGGKSNPRNGVLGTGIRVIGIGGIYAVKYAYRTLILKPTCIILGEDVARDVNDAVTTVTKPVEDTIRGGIGATANGLDGLANLLGSPWLVVAVALVAGYYIYTNYLSSDDMVSFQQLRDKATGNTSQ